MINGNSSSCAARFISGLVGSAWLYTLLFAGPANGADADAPWREQATKGIGKGVEYLLDQQREDGAFGKRPHPGITALCAYALQNSPSAERDAVQTAIDKALENLRAFAGENGAIQPERHGVPVYTTSVALLAFDAVGREKDEDIIRRGRDFLLSAQRREEGPEGETRLSGFGYDKGARPDMSNTKWAIEALHATREYAEEPLAESADAANKARAAFKGAVSFIEQCQNTDEDSEHRGRVSYLPQTKDADEKNQQSSRGARKPPQANYGAMTYGAMKTMIYADLSRDDPRVQSALRWIRRHYTFQENPGQGMNSYYYYIQTCAKALAALEVTQIVEESEDWRADLVSALLERQKEEGSWINEVGRHWESDPNLVTAYSLIALEHALPPIRQQP
ncbi:MAG: prenyltransferase/squalene oxidase repeat-containing protein [Verrucomicrobiota bacterium]